MGLAGVAFGGGGPGDDRLEDHQGRLVADRLAALDGGEQGVDVLDVAVAPAGAPGAAPVDGDDVPAVGLVALAHVLGERDVGVVLDGDVVLVVDHRQVAQLLVPGKGTGLVGDALHHVAVGGDHVDVVVERARPGRCVRVQQTALAARGERHPDCRGETGAQRSGRDLHTGGVAHLRVTRGQGSPRAQLLQVVELEAVAGQVQLDVLRQAGVATGEDEPVTAQPRRVGGVVTHHVLVEQVGQRRQAHGGAWVAVAGSLDGVGGEQSHRVDGSHIQVGPSGAGGDWNRQGRVADPGRVALVNLGGGLVGHGSSLSRERRGLVSSFRGCANTQRR